MSMKEYFFTFFVFDMSELSFEPWILILDVNVKKYFFIDFLSAVFCQKLWE